MKPSRFPFCPILPHYCTLGGNTTCSPILHTVLHKMFFFLKRKGKEQLKSIHSKTERGSSQCSGWTSRSFAKSELLPPECLFMNESIYHTYRCCVYEESVYHMLEDKASLLSSINTIFLISASVVEVPTSYLPIRLLEFPKTTTLS